jgi:hypothetical protein
MSASVPTARWARTKLARVIGLGWEAMMGKAAGSRPAKAANKSGAIAMPIRRLLENHVFGPDEITVLTTAFEDTLRTLRLVDRADPATEIIARKIIELAAQGERDPVRLRERAIQFLSQ